MIFRIKSHSLGVTVLLVTLAVCIATTLAAPAQEQQLEDQHTIVTSARSRFSLPKLFDFEGYKDLFEKTYGSLTEVIVRQKLFAARAFRAFVSAIKYKYGLSSAYLKINARSDWTPEEIKTSKLRPGSKLFETAPEAYDNVVSLPQTTPQFGGNSNGEPEVVLVDHEQLEHQLKDIVEHDHEPGYRQIAAELAPEQDSNRKKRAAPQIRELSIEDLIGQPHLEEEPALEAKINPRPVGNNPRYLAPEMITFGGSNQLKPLKNVDYYTVMSEAQKEQATEGIRSIFSSLATQLSRVITSGEPEESREDSSHHDKEKTSVVADSKSKSLPDNIVYVDHRNSKCFVQPRDQGFCGSCYAFAFISQMEWMHCKETGEFVPFSEQYIVDCGHRNGLRGCDGGDAPRVAQFAHNFGLELRSMYPYMDRQDTCPYSAETEPEQMGYFRINIGRTAIVPQDAFAEYLKHSPMIVGVATENTNFEEYGGGVASGAGCGPDEDHAMLLVGHGREEGREYWLLRNSHSTSFGEGGYYKLAKSSGCIRTSGFIFGSTDGKHMRLSPQRNEKNDGQIVASSRVTAT